MNDELIEASASIEVSHAQETSAGEEQQLANPLEEAHNNNEIRKLLDEEQLNELYDVFVMFDTDESGAIDIKELKQVMYDLKMNVTEEDT